ncbi:MAG: SulP family inorganic anion transporter [Acidimicrobiales bacterium]
MTFKPAIARWLPSYERSWLRADAVSGSTVAAVMIPSALSYAAIVGVEPIVGLYTVPFALIAYAIFGGSRLLAVGPDAAVSVLAASTIAAVATDDENYLEVMLALSLIVGAVYLLFALLRMGWIADLVPDPVLKGFIQGLVWVTILGQVPDLLGVTPEEDFPDFWRDFREIVQVLDDIQTQTAVLGIGSLVTLYLLKRFVPKIPGSLVVLIGSMVIVAAASLGDEGVAVVGEPSGGFFNFGLPSGLSAGQWVDLIPGAAAIVVLGFTESMGAAKSAAQKTGERLDPNEELLALGTSNLGSGLAGGYPVTGTLSKTSVAMSSGGKTQLGNVFAAILAILSVLILKPLFEQLASTVLAALIIFAMAGMLDLGFVSRLWRVGRGECLLAVLAFLGVLTFGVLAGVVIGVVFALGLLVEHISRAKAMVVGRTPDGEWRDVAVVADAVPPGGMFVFRYEGPIVFVNARSITDQIRLLVGPDVKVVLLDTSAVSSFDSTGLAMMTMLRDELAARSVEFWLVNPSIRKRRMLDGEGEALGVILPKRFDSIDEAVADFQRSRGAS